MSCNESEVKKVGILTLLTLYQVQILDDIIDLNLISSHSVNLTSVKVWVQKQHNLHPVLLLYNFEKTLSASSRVFGAMFMIQR